MRSEPKSGENVIDQLEYGTEVIVEGPVIINADWSCIRNKKGKDGVAYVMTRYLVNSKPGDTEKVLAEKERKANLEELNRQLSSARPLETPLLIVVRATRASGWINFRVGPGVAADRIASLPDGRELKAISETDKWYQAIDSESGKTGYVSKKIRDRAGKRERRARRPRQGADGQAECERRVRVSMPAARRVHHAAHQYAGHQNQRLHYLRRQGKARYMIDHGFPVIEHFYSDSLADTPIALCAEKAHFVTDKAQTVSDWPHLDPKTMKEVRRKINTGWTIFI